MFSADPAVGFLAHASRFAEAAGRGELLAPAKAMDEMRQIVFNDRIDAALAACSSPWWSPSWSSASAPASRPTAPSAGPRGRSATPAGWPPNDRAPPGLAALPVRHRAADGRAAELRGSMSSTSGGCTRTEPPMSRAEFFRDREAARYGGGDARLSAAAEGKVGEEKAFPRQTPPLLFGWVGYQLPEIEVGSGEDTSSPAFSIELLAPAGRGRQTPPHKRGRRTMRMQDKVAVDHRRRLRSRQADSGALPRGRRPCRHRRHPGRRRHAAGRAARPGRPLHPLRRDARRPRSPAAVALADASLGPARPDVQQCRPPRRPEPDRDHAGRGLGRDLRACWCARSCSASSTRRRS